MKKIFTIFLAGILSVPMFAQTTMENFNYGTTADTLTNPSIGGTAWKRHSGTGGPLGYSTTSLSYTGYNSSGIGGAVTFAHASGSKEDANMPTLVYNSGSVYASFLLNVSVSGGTTGDYFFHFMDSSGATPGTNFRGRLFFKDGSTTGTFKLGLSKGSAAASAVFGSTDYTIGTPLLVVLKYTFNPSFSDTVYGYVFTSGVPASEPASANFATSVAADVALSDLSKIKSVALRQGTVGTGAGTVDGIRVSHIWGDGPLPVTLNYFKAYQDGKSVQLSWETATERNNRGFEVQKSHDGANFESIVFIQGKGNSSRVNLYHYTDENFDGTTTYYRLKQVDFDGQISYSEMAVINSDEPSVEIGPNPFENQIIVKSGRPGTSVSVEVLDISGKTRLVKEGVGVILIDTHDLSEGVYFLRINHGNRITSRRVIKK